MRLTVLVIGVLLLMGGTSTAQEEKGSLSGGYRFAASNGVTYPFGWYGDTNRHLNNLISIVGDVSGAYKQESFTFGTFTQTTTARIHTFMGGARVYASTRNPDVLAFGQALFGAAHLRLSTTTLTRSTTEPAVGLSAGVDVNDFPVPLRFQLGWLRVFEEGEGANVFHFGVGAKLRF